MVLNLSDLKKTLQEKAQSLKNTVVDPRDEAAKLRIELNMAKNDVKSKQEKLDKLAPEEAIVRKTSAAETELKKYTDETKAKFDSELKLYNILLEEVNVMANNANGIITNKYKEQLAKKQALLKLMNTEKKETAFTNRRRFLDSEPQKPIGGFLSFESADSQVMLAFWISYLLIICAIGTIIISKYGSQIGSAKILAFIGIVVIFVLVIIAHLIIQAVATR